MDISEPGEKQIFNLWQLQPEKIMSPWIKGHSVQNMIWSQKSPYSNESSSDHKIQNL